MDPRLALAALAIAACRPSVPSREVSAAPDGEAATAPSSTLATPATTPSLQRVPGRLVAGDEFTCALDRAGAAWCWGNNDRGQLGNGSELPSTRPVRVVNLGRALMLAAGSDHACALVEGGEVWCWGANASRQLGDRTTDLRRAPIRVSDIGPATAILAGPAFSCAAVDTGVLCWGDAPPHSEPRWKMQKTPGPALVPELARIDFACSRPYVACAGAGGRVLCWGYIRHHVAFGHQWFPAVDDAVAVSCGFERGCVLRSDGSIICSDDVGLEFGSGIYPRAAAALYSAAPPATDIVDNGGAACLLDGKGAVWCESRSGDWRDVHPEMRRKVLERVGTHEGFVALALGAGGHLCALAGDGAVACVGDNRWGQAGGGVPLSALKPEPIDGAKDLTGLAAAGFRTCGLRNGVLHCWGEQTTAATNHEPAIVEGSSGPSLAVWISDARLCVERPDRKIACSDGQTNAIDKPIRQVDPGSGCRLGTNGVVECAKGRLDARSFARGDPAGDPPVPTDIVELASNTYGWEGIHCGRRRDGRVTCVKVGMTPLRSQDVTLADRTGKSTTLRDASQLVAHGSEICAVRRSGQVVCWTADERFQLQATPIPGIADAVELASGGWHKCVRQRDGGVRCWGRNQCGQLGDGTVADRASPGVIVLDDAVDLVAGLCHTCARRRSGEVWCWGQHGGEPRAGRAKPTAEYTDFVPIVGIGTP